MFSKYLKITGIGTTVLGFAPSDHDGKPYDEPVDLSFSLGASTSKVLIAMSLDDAKELARAIGGAIQHVENDIAVLAAQLPVGEQS